MKRTIRSRNGSGVGASTVPTPGATAHTFNHYDIVDGLTDIVFMSTPFRDDNDMQRCISSYMIGLSRLKVINDYWLNHFIKPDGSTGLQVVFQVEPTDQFVHTTIG